MPCLLCRSAVMKAYFPGVALVGAFANLPLKSHAHLHHLPTRISSHGVISPANSSDTGERNTSWHASAVRKEGCLPSSHTAKAQICLLALCGGASGSG